MKKMKSCPNFYWSVGYGAKETRGTPNRHQCWNRIGSARKDIAGGISKLPVAT